MQKKYNFDHLISFAASAKLLGYTFASLHYHKKNGRFVKPLVRIAGREFYEKSKVLDWKPKDIKRGRPKK